MTVQITGTIVGRELDLTSIVITEAALAVADDEVALYANVDVPTYRQLEISDGWEWLWAGIRDRNLLDDQFAAAVLYTMVDIDQLTTENRRTSSVFAEILANDIAIGIGINVTTLFHGAVIPLDSTILKLRDWARDYYYKQR